MLALTLWPEWAFAICYLGKRVENRTWDPRPRIQIGERFAIHAGKHMGGRPGRPADLEAADAVARMSPDPVRLERLLACTRSALVCTVVLAGVDREQRTPWDVPGELHWRLADVQLLGHPVPMAGRQGLWVVPDWVQPYIDVRDLAARSQAEPEQLGLLPPRSARRPERAAAPVIRVAWNPRWLAYCTAEGVAPEDASAARFLGWVQERKAEFETAEGVDLSRLLVAEEGRQRWTAWLQRRAGELRSE